MTETPPGSPIEAGGASPSPTEAETAPAEVRESGWRAPSVVAGMVALIALYLIVVAAGETAWLALLAVAIYGLDNLSFVHARIGTLDMMALAFILVGAWLGLKRRPALAGVAFALG